MNNTAPERTTTKRISVDAGCIWITTGPTQALYDAHCALESSDEGAQISSGYGNGTYNVTVTKKDGIVKSALIEFVDDECDDTEGATA